MATAYYEFYRGSSYVQCFPWVQTSPYNGFAALAWRSPTRWTNLLPSGAITPQLAMKVLQQVLHIASYHTASALTDSIDSLSVQGHLHTYRLCDDVWTFIVKNPSFKMESNEMVSAPRIKIIACKNGDAIEAGKK
ncbi:transcription initiation factor IIA, gamma subunit-domain-containing protein [Chiua virens]|nr:transcription initiation factor IIA, gamma subunit-domain-containing protein [Chiua virens]